MRRRALGIPYLHDCTSLKNSAGRVAPYNPILHRPEAVRRFFLMRGRLRALQSPQRSQAHASAIPTARQQGGARRNRSGPRRQVPTLRVQRPSCVGNRPCSRWRHSSTATVRGQLLQQGQADNTERFSGLPIALLQLQRDQEARAARAQKQDSLHQCGVEQRVARLAHNQEVGGSNPLPATNYRDSQRRVPATNAQGCRVRVGRPRYTIASCTAEGRQQRARQTCLGPLSQSALARATLLRARLGCGWKSGRVGGWSSDRPPAPIYGFPSVRRWPVTAAGGGVETLRRATPRLERDPRHSLASTKQLTVRKGAHLPATMRRPRTRVTGTSLPHT